MRSLHQSGLDCEEELHGVVRQEMQHLRNQKVFPNPVAKAGLAAGTAIAPLHPSVPQRTCGPTDVGARVVSMALQPHQCSCQRPSAVAAAVAGVGLPVVATVASAATAAAPMDDPRYCCRNRSLSGLDGIEVLTTERHCHEEVAPLGIGQYVQYSHPTKAMAKCEAGERRAAGSRGAQGAASPSVGQSPAGGFRAASANSRSAHRRGQGRAAG